MPRKINIELFTILKGIGVYHNNHAYWKLEKVMRNLIPSGIPQHIRKSIFDVRFKYSVDPVKIPSKLLNLVTSPKVFSLEDLSFEFVIWLVSISVAVAVFMIEVAYVFGKKCVINLTGLYFFLKLLTSLRNY